MPRHSEAKVWAMNHAKYMSKKAKSDTEKRRWFNIFLTLTELLSIEIHDDKTVEPVTAALPNLDEQAANALKRINGGDNGGN
jgi:hypothetical protein